MCRAHPHVGENLRHHYRFQREAADGGELPRPLQPRASRPGDRTPEAHPQRALHWKVVFVYINKTGQVRLKMKSKHVAGTITRKNRNYTPTVGRRGAAPLLQAEYGGAAGHRVRLPQSTGIRTPDERCRTPPPRRRCDKPKLPPLPPSES